MEKGGEELEWVGIPKKIKMVIKHAGPVGVRQLKIKNGYKEHSIYLQ